MPKDINLQEAPIKYSNLYWTQIEPDNCEEQILHLLCFFLLVSLTLFLSFTGYRIVLLLLLNQMKTFSRRSMSKDYFDKQSISLS